MGWMFPINNRRRRIKRGEASILRTLPNWKRAREVCAAFVYRCLQSLFALYLIYKQMRHYGRQQGRALPVYSCTVTVEEKQELYQRLEALERTVDGLGGPNASEERLTELESQVTQLQQAFSLSKPAVASPEEQKHVLLTARSFVARHGVDWNQMQVWIDTQALVPALSAESLSDYLLTSDQQSMLIHYWKSRKIPYTPCEQCPHYILFGPQT